MRLIGADFQSVVVTAVGAANPATAIPGQTVALESTGSSGDITSYAWTQVGGPKVTLNGANTDVATFVAPTGASTDLTFELTTASAGGLSTAKTQVGVHVQSGAAPVANAGADQNAIVETQITAAGA